MRAFGRALRVVAVAAAFVCVAAAAAHASRLQIDNWERGIRLKWSSIQFTVAGRTVDCEIYLNGDFQIVGMAVLIMPTMGPSCLVRTSATNPALLIANVEREEPTFQNIRLNETALIPESGLMCGGTATFGGGG